MLSLKEEWFLELSKVSFWERIRRLLSYPIRDGGRLKDFICYLRQGIILFGRHDFEKGSFWFKYCLQRMMFPITVGVHDYIEYLKFIRRFRKLANEKS